MFTHLKQRGISLIELIMFIVVMSVGLAAVIVPLNQMAQNSPDTLLRKEAFTVAESILEQIEAQNFSNITNVNMTTIVNSTLPASGVVGASAVLSFGGTSAVSVTVTVSNVIGQSYGLSGYRTNHY